MRWLSVLVLSSTLAASVDAHADTSTSSIGAGRRTLSLGAAIVPGVLVHGAGHYAAGDTETALLLLGVEGIGVLGVLSGLAGLALTGASAKTVIPFSAMTMGGVGLFASSLIADVYGVATLGLGVDDPQLRMWPIETSIGVAYVSDRIFEYGAFATWTLALRSDRWRFAPSAWVALDDDNARLRGEIAYRTLGGANNYLDLTFALTHHHYGTHDFAITTGEAAAESRIQLSRFTPTLRGAFVEAGLGVGLESHRVFDRSIHTTTLLLGGFGFGLNLQNFETALYYDHRHDGFAAGLKAAGLGSGVGGHFGARAAWFHDAFGVSAFAESGSANVVGVALAYRGAP